MKVKDHTKILKKDLALAQQMIDYMLPIPGEIRIINKCTECGQLSGKRFIPFGLGRGYSMNKCLCEATGSGKRIRILESKP